MRYRKAPFDALTLMRKLGLAWQPTRACHPAERPFHLHRAGARIPRLRLAYGPRVTGGNPAWEKPGRR